MKLILRKEQRRGLRISALLPAHNQITAPQFQTVDKALLLQGFAIVGTAFLI